jgi:hypothetical protein
MNTSASTDTEHEDRTVTARIMEGELSAQFLPVRTARVVEVRDDNTVQVEFGHEALSCEVLVTSGAASRLVLATGDVVLVLPPIDERTMGIILGRIGSSHDAEDVAPSESVVDEMVIEAKESLTLKVGDGSITIRKDGRILIKGKDLVSHASRANRIRGGSVQIN